MTMENGKEEKSPKRKTHLLMIDEYKRLINEAALPRHLNSQMAIDLKNKAREIKADLYLGIYA